MGRRFFVRDGETRITCEELVDFLHQYLEQELTAERNDLFERHLGRCASCVAYLETYRATLLLARCAGDEPQGLPPLPEELVEAIIRARSA